MYPKNEEQHFELGDTVLFKNSYLITKTRGKIRNYAVSESVKKISSQPVPLRQKQVTELLEQAKWQSIQPTTKPVAKILTVNGEYSVWDEEALIIGNGELGVVIDQQALKLWLSAWQEVNE